MVSIFIVMCFLHFIVVESVKYAGLLRATLRPRLRKVGMK